MSNRTKKRQRLGLVGPRGDVRDLPPATPPGPIPPTRPIGTVVKVGEEDRATLREAFKPVLDATTALGSLRNDYVLRERNIVETLGQQRAKYNDMVVTIGKKLGVTIKDGEGWRYDAETGQLERVN